MIGDLLASYLAPMPSYKVLGRALDGRTALEECLKLKPDILVLDLELPEMNGVQIVRRLVEARSSTRIVVFSSRADRATIRHLVELGVKGIVEKPAELSSLLQAIDAVGHGRAFFGPATIQILQQAFSDPMATRTEDNLTLREREVLQLVAEGRSNKEVATKLEISLKTVENHRHNLMAKLNAHNGADLTREAFRLGLIALP